MKEPTESAGTEPAANGLPLSEGRMLDVSGAAQRKRIGDYLLKHGRATTIDLRDHANAMSPAARIIEMRAIGWPIKTVWIWTHDAQGRPHRCGLYVLTRGGVNHG